MQFLFQSIVYYLSISIAAINSNTDRAEKRRAKKEILTTFKRDSKIKDEARVIGPKRRDEGAGGQRGLDLYYIIPA